jgi:hypothetical protein
MATPPGKVPIAETAAAGLKFLTENWRRILPACALMGVAQGFHLYAAAQAHANASAAPLALLGSVAVLLLTILLGASFYRLALRNQYPGVLGVAFGADERVYFGAVIWSALPLLLIIFIAMFGLAAILMPDLRASGMTPEQATADQAFMTSLAQKHAGPIVSIFLAALILIAWISLRLVLAAPATIDSGKIKVWSTSTWTKGNVWRIFGAILMLLAPITILMLVIQSIAALAVGVNPEQAQAGTAAPTPSVAIYGFIYGLTTGVSLAPMAGLASYLYKGLRPPPEG